MKMAKVTSVRFTEATKADEMPGGDTATPEWDIAGSLRSYPRISETERRRLLLFLRRASRTEIRDAFLRKGLEPRLIAFRKDHKAELRRGLRAWAPALLALLLLAELLQMLI